MSPFNSLINLNIRGLLIKKDRSKVKQLEYIMRQNNVIFAVITETWLDSSVLDSEIYIKGYNIYRSDRMHRKRGGTCIYVRNDIHFRFSKK